MSGEGRLAAIMFTDIVGYTSLSQKDEALAMQLLEEHRSLVRPFFQKHKGREVKTIGDAFLVEFASALEAVRCAFEIQQSMHEMNAGRLPEKQVQLRIGVHVGDVIHNQNDVYGDAVNVASRIEPLAMPGSICVSGQIYDHIKNKFEFPLTSIGKRELKNVGEPIEVYKVVMPWERAPAAEIPNLANRIAVLPFANMSPDPNDEYFADDMTDEIISTLSRLENVEVISRTSVMQYRRNAKPIGEVSKELNVGTVLEGSVRKAGNKLRIATQMIDATKDRHLWAETYDRTLEDVFAVQSEVAERVANALQVRMRKAGLGEPPADMEAYMMYLRGMQLFHELTPTSCGEAISLFEGAISKDPKFARAYAGLAQTWIYMDTWADFTDSVNRAEVAARNALELDPESAEAHVAMGAVYGALDRFDESRLEFERAIQVNPNFVDAIKWLGVRDLNSARFGEATSYFQKARSLDPLDPDPGLYLAIVLRVTRNTRDALEMLAEIKELHWKVPWVYFQTASCHLQNKDFAEALSIIDAGLRLNPDEQNLKTLRGVAHALSGRRLEALEELQELMMDESESKRLNAQVWIRMALRDYDEAYEALMREAELHAWWPLIKFDPLWAGLRDDPRFAEFCKKVGLPP